MYSFFAALTFLTIIPVPRHISEKCKFDDCQKFFPVIGIIIGLIAAVVTYILFLILPPLVAASLATITLIKLTGGLHLDGLSDTVDGICSHRNKEEILRIMKDSRIGSFGSIAQVCLIIVKIASLYELSSSAYLGIFLAPVIGRTCIIFITRFIPPANKSGLGYSVTSGPNTFPLVYGILLSLIIGIFFFGYYGLFSLVLSLATVYILGKMCEKKIGGYTGDILGASCEYGEMVALIVLSASVM